jgi:hypothetical protein
LTVDVAGLDFYSNGELTMPRTLAAPSEEATLADTIDHRMRLYSVAAAAAGVSMLALVTPAEAEVVVTKANLQVPINAHVSIDLNKDGVADFELSEFAYFDFAFVNSVKVRALAGGAVVGYPGGIGPYASALIRGAKIGPSAHFSTGSSGVIVERSLGTVRSNSTTQRLYGKWGHDPRNRYIGVKLLIHGATHYGWVRLTLTTDHPASMTATITGYAYETIPNKPILAGTPAKPEVKAQVEDNVLHAGAPSLGMLALGAEGLALWRRDESLPA